jgi:hypothetical protein
MGQRRACPVEEHACVSLQPAAFKKGVRVTITSVVLRAFEPLSDTDVRNLGHFSQEGARAAWRRSYGPVTPETTVWAVSFALGDRTAFYGQHAERYMKAKMGGGRSITTDPARAVRGEGAVPAEDEMRFAAKAALTRRVEAQKALERGVGVIEREVREMRGHDLDEASRKDLEYLEDRAARMRKRLHPEAA